MSNTPGTRLRAKTASGMAIGIVMIATLATSTTAVAAIQGSGTFIDDDGNIHEPNIEAIAGAGITLGCNPPLNDRFCPADPVSRAEMAAMLIRAMGETGNLPPYQRLFTDVPEGQWYTGFVERAAQLGVTSGYVDGTFRPHAPVSRAETAALVLRAIGDRMEAPIYMGLFVDVPPDAWFAEYVERLYQIRVSAGCGVDPPRYCPFASVRRDETATFIARAFGIPAVNPVFTHPS